ncbi:EAL domain-containing protein [Sphingobium sp. AN641]|uniref:putative bifunctional diguanylate cyclase/phosphodiesterase n=1 Tax=Sphingobium sp. AN641 TaxID=3133443 RepID=UPI0030C2B8C2
MIGAVPPGDAVASRTVAAQLKFSDAVAPVRVALNILALIFIWRVFDDSAPVGWLLAWSGAMLCVTIATFYMARQRRQANYAMPSEHDVRMLGMAGFLHGMLWASSMLIFPGANSPGELMALWTLLSCIMVCGTITFAAAPVAAMGFLLPVAWATQFMFPTPVYGSLRAMAIGYAAALLIGAFFYCRVFIRQHSTSVQLEEKSEVVSLLLREFEDKGSDWLWQTDAARRISGVSSRFAEMLGLDSAALEGTPLVQVLAGSAWESGRFASGLHELAEKLKLRNAFSNLVLPVEIGGVQRWWELSASPRFDERGIFQGFRGVGSDITIQRESAEKIALLARFDPLTGLPNRAHLHERLDQAMADTDHRGRGCVFLMIDLDRFKAVNDTLGHQIGDKLLGQVARRLRQICSDREFCGRIGGDEFGVVISNAVDKFDVADLAGAIIGALSRPYQIDQHTLYVGACVGSAVSPTDGRTSEALIRSADLALYRAKGEGGGIHCAYEPQLHVEAEERRKLEMALREALEKDQLHVLYQPVVDARQGSVLGFEALVRWTHPEMGPISPAKFVPVAEEARLIAPIGEWVLRTACAEAVRWPEDVRIAVNVSAEQLINPQFPTVVAQILAQSGLNAARLELEVTESVFMNEDAGALRVLDQVLALGVRLSLDDFGTGYSSLGYLSRTKFSTIKIDRSFVVGAANEVPESLAIVRAVVTLADSLGMTTTAEGVETEVELAMVNRLGCTKVQGFYFGRPMLARDAVLLFGPEQYQARA